MAKYKYYFPDAGLTVEEDADLARPEEDRETEASKNKRLQEQLKVSHFTVADHFKKSSVSKEVQSNQVQSSISYNFCFFDVERSFVSYPSTVRFWGFSQCARGVEPNCLLTLFANCFSFMHSHFIILLF